MDGIYTVSFFGHRVVQRFDDADGAVYDLICAFLWVLPKATRRFLFSYVVQFKYK